MEYKTLSVSRRTVSPIGKTYILNLSIVVVLLVISSLIFLSYTDTRYQHRKLTPRLERHLVKLNFTSKPYLIDTPKCKIPLVNPFIEEVKEFHHSEEYTPCSDKNLLSYIEKKDDSVTLNINQSLVSSYTFFKLHCCYSVVTRHATFEKPDDTIKISDCVPFEGSVAINDPVVMVSCKNLFLKEVYTNVHAIITLRNVSKENTYKTMADPSSAPSVLLVGIDSISKLNLVRTMPRTFNFLENSDFVNLKGYTKVGLNTLPNLLGMLSGRTRAQAEEVCDVNNSIDDCPFIWEKFKETNYITGYGEDSTYIGSFNYQKKGFTHPPTDFYFRPYVLAAERLKIISRGGMYFCTGPETSAERILNLAKDFQITLKDYPKFGLFWMNSFSHDDLNMPSAMDKRVEQFLEDIFDHLDNTVFFFFSDHGFRFGKIRNTQTGWLEERIPFFYVHFPESFRRKFPQLYGNFRINSERLTNAFDIYMTLQHLLLLADPKFAVERSVGCPKCHSLFEEVSEERSCEDAAIEENWCVCNARTYVNPKARRVQKAALFLVRWVNEMIKRFPEGDRCHRYKLDKVIYSAISQFTAEKGNKTGTRLLLRVRTRPNATFESSVELPSKVSNLTFRVMGDVSRLNRYAPYTKCLKNSQLEKHCYCKDAVVKN